MDEYLRGIPWTRPASLHRGGFNPEDLPGGASEGSPTAAPPKISFILHAHVDSLDIS